MRLLLVSPDSALGRFPFGALPGKKPGSYLIEEISVALVPFPQMLPDLLGPEEIAPNDEKTKERVPSEAPSLLLVGDVDYGGEAGDTPFANKTDGDRGAPKEALFQGAILSAPRGGRLLSFRPLNLTEIPRVADTFEEAYPGAKIEKLRGKGASEAAFREKAPRHRFIHLATHGFFAPPELKSALSAPSDSGMKALGMEPGKGLTGSISGWHPGLLSGIALSGANRQWEGEGDDGILTALELAPLDLSGCDLLCFSACETGLGGTAGGEGLLGLQRAAQIAGARTVVATLWKVNDRDAQALMERFYMNLWKKRMPKLEALREAQLALLRGDIARGPGAAEPHPEGEPFRAPPSTWAAWVLSGDWR